MVYQSNEIVVKQLDNGIVELVFDLKDDSVNKLNRVTVASLEKALKAIDAQPGVRGLLISSAKEVFIVGADVAEFVPLFAADDETMREVVAENNRNYNRMASLPYPTCVAINGYALGGGLEICLACDFRVLSKTAKIGLPESKLGILPAWGGATRLPRMIGVDEAVTWMATGKEYRADDALRAGVVDAVAAPEKLRSVALTTLQQAIDGKLDYQTRRDVKNSPMPLNPVEAMMSFFTIKAMVAQQAGRNYPAPVKIVEVIEKAFGKNFEEAQEIEAQGFVALAKTDVARALVGIFLSDQLLGKKAKNWEARADSEIVQAGVLGAGIMGGGIAYQSAYKGIPIKMKDIAQQGLDLGLEEASKLLAKRVDRGVMTPSEMGAVLNKIDPTLSYSGFDAVDIVVEAVVENTKVKQAVLAEVEKEIRDTAILASNTSTISISLLAESLQRPENFCGMHFFNPVHAMPLVEVIRGEKTSDRAVATTVAYANRMGKKAIVVNDCPGFLVNRVLFPYFDAFSKLIRDGADFQQVDREMERWGWPMGPAYLADVVGIDTCVHAGEVMAAGFPDRMTLDFRSGLQALFEAGHYGQKSGRGFYEYVPDKRGKPAKQVDDSVYDLLKPVSGETKDYSNEEIIARMMLPMCTELARCLEEGVVGSVAEADLALVYGLGFPPFRGGVFRWLDTIGMQSLAEMSKTYEHLGKSYELTEGMQEKLSSGEPYYQAVAAGESKS